MAVFRIERTRDYTVMSNHHLRDKALSLKSKGLLSMMLSLPEDWNYEKEAVNSNWSVRELKRQIDSSLYERLLLSNGDTNLD